MGPDVRIPNMAEGLASEPLIAALLEEEGDTSASVPVFEMPSDPLLPDPSKHEAS
jgi:hypothetical protein